MAWTLTDLLANAKELFDGLRANGSELAAVKLRNTQLETDFAALNTSHSAALAAQNSELIAARQSLATATEQFTAASTAHAAALVAKDAEVEAKASAKASLIVASLGGPPLKVDPTGKAAPTGEKPDLSHLHGADRFIAFEKWEASQRGKK